MSKKSYVQDIRDVMAEEMRRDEKVFVMGEDIEVLGGIFGATRGLADEFGADRVRNTPISEAGFISAGLGAACAGMRPIVELMYMDFSLVAADSIINQVAKTRYIFGGKAKVPLVIRGQQGVGRGNAATHSQSLEALFMHFPGLKVAMPSTAEDAAGLLRTAIRDDNPVVFFNHTSIGGMKGEVPDEEYLIPLGKGDIKKEGKDITLCAVGIMVNHCLKAAAQLEKEGISAEVVDLRTLKPWDKELVLESVKKTGRFLAVDESYKTCGAGAEWVATVAEEAFSDLKCPASRLSGEEIPIPFSPVLQQLAVPNKDTIAAKVREMVKK